MPGGGQALGGGGGEDGQSRLGPHPGDPGEELEAGPLLLAGEAVELHGVLPDVQVGVQLGGLPYGEGGDGVAGGPAGVAHAAAVHHGQVGPQMADGPVEIVKHGWFSLFCYAKTIDGMPSPRPCGATGLDAKKLHAPVILLLFAVCKNRA